MLLQCIAHMDLAEKVKAWFYNPESLSIMILRYLAVRQCGTTLCNMQKGYRHLFFLHVSHLLCYCSFNKIACRSQFLTAFGRLSGVNFFLCAQHFSQAASGRDGGDKLILTHQFKSVLALLLLFWCFCMSNRY